ncbi:Uncharacterised protein [Mycobacteroides abscessus subsp. abscessus]|nr:Uncharacterised protein [Mycobacteroides abscessus subsp. abscessus]
MPEVAHVVGEHVVAGVMQVLVVRHEVDFKVITARRADLLPRFQMCGQAVAVMPDWVVGDRDLVGALTWNEPGIQRNAVLRGEGHRLVLQAVLVRPVQDRRPDRTPERLGELLDELIDLIDLLRHACPFHFFDWNVSKSLTSSR